jgi:hypothetical protein
MVFSIIEMEPYILLLHPENESTNFFMKQNKRVF